MRRPFGPTRPPEAGFPPRFRVLFLCERNAGWSVLAEALLNRTGPDRFEAYSAGLLPGTAVDPLVEHLLGANGLGQSRPFCKSFEGFRLANALPLDFLISPVDLDGLGLASGWPGHPAVLHWHMADPLAAPLASRGAALQRCLNDLQNRLHLFLALPPDKVARLAATGHALDLGAPNPLAGAEDWLLTGGRRT